MNILWITNITFPEALRLLHGKGDLKATGGWLLGAAESLCRKSDLKLYVASLSTRVKSLTRLEGESIIYYLLPYGKGCDKINRDYEPLFKTIHDEIHPDIVHIHGTEYSHGLAYLEACGADNVCVSIQGMTSTIYYYYYYGITSFRVLRSFTFASLITGGTLKGYNRMKKRSKIEIEIIKRVKHILGRTSWDRSHTWAINPNATYHYGGETLRKEFYSGPVWNYQHCRPHSIFISQARTPIKGLHMILRAMPLVLQHYPDTIIRIAGDDLTRRNGSWKERLKLSDYGHYILKLVKDYKLDDKIQFTGPLDAEEMKSEYLKANVFICPSTIENSPNSLGEAQILGVPVIASYVGGVPDMMMGDEEHLYRFEEIEMLANKICCLFENEANQPQVAKMRDVAFSRHNPQKNSEDLLMIYRKILKG